MSLTYLEPMPKRCPTCPFRRRGFTEVRELLTERALCSRTPICHSTGDSDVVPKSKKLCVENRACRGARDLQLKMFRATGVLSEETDECWKAKVDEINAGKKP